MSNSTTPFGFRSFGHRDGSAPTMGLERISFPTSDTNLYFTGDPVTRSSLYTGGGLRYPMGSTDMAAIAGIFAGCEYYSPTFQRVTWSSYYPGSVGSSSPANAYVITDPEMQFIVWSTATYASSSIGLTVAIITSQSSLGNTTNGQSVCYVTGGTTRTNSSDPFVIVDLYANFAPPNSAGTESTTYNLIVVAPNHWGRKPGAITVATS